MASNSYIQLNADSLTSTVGKRLMLGIISIKREKGTPTTDLPIPSKSSDKRQLLPLAGEINDFSVTCSLETEDTNVGFEVAVGGGTSSDDIFSVVEQYNYLYDTLLASKINAKYTLYLDWLNKTFEGIITVDSDVSPDSFTGQVLVTIEFKEGDNFLSVS